MTDQPPTSPGAKVGAAGIGAGLILALALLFRHHGTPHQPPVTATAGPPPVAMTETGLQPSPSSQPVPSIPSTESTTLPVVTLPVPASSTTPASALPHYVPPDYGPDLCDLPVTVAVEPEWEASARENGCITGEAMWNPAAHGINWNIDPHTIRAKVIALSSDIAAGQAHVTVKSFPCVSLFAFSWVGGCRIITVRKPGELPQMPLHASAASVMVPVHVPLRCGLTTRDAYNRIVPLNPCTVREILLGPGAWRDENGVAHRAEESQQ